MVNRVCYHATGIAPIHTLRILPTTLQGRCNHLHFTDEEADACRGKAAIKRCIYYPLPDDRTQCTSVSKENLLKGRCTWGPGAQEEEWKRPLRQRGENQNTAGQRCCWEAAHGPSTWAWGRGHVYQRVGLLDPSCEDEETELGFCLFVCFFCLHQMP